MAALEEDCEEDRADAAEDEVRGGEGNLPTVILHFVVWGLSYFAVHETAHCVPDLPITVMLLVFFF